MSDRSPRTGPIPGAPRAVPVRLLPHLRRARDEIGLTVTEICLLVGYRSLGTFSRRFRELTGESPSDYRDRWGRTGQAHVPGCYLFMRGVYELDLGRRGAIPEKPAPPAGRSVGS